MVSGIIPKQLLEMINFWISSSDSSGEEFVAVSDQVATAKVISSLTDKDGKKYVGIHDHKFINNSNIIIIYHHHNNYYNHYNYNYSIWNSSVLLHHWQTVWSMCCSR